MLIDYQQSNHFYREHPLESRFAFVGHQSENDRTVLCQFRLCTGLPRCSSLAASRSFGSVIVGAFFVTELTRPPVPLLSNPFLRVTAYADNCLSGSSIETVIRH